MKLSEANDNPLPGLSGFGTWMLWDLSDRTSGETGGIPLSWKTVKHYEAAVAQGYAEEVDQPNRFVRRFRITEAGRAALAQREG